MNLDTHMYPDHEWYPKITITKRKEIEGSYGSTHDRSAL